MLLRCAMCLYVLLCLVLMRSCCCVFCFDVVSFDLLCFGLLNCIDLVCVSVVCFALCELVVSFVLSCCVWCFV